MSAGITNLKEAEFDAFVAQGTVLLDFWAPWCGPCRMMGPILEELLPKLPAGAKIAKINVDEEAGVAAKFNVRSIPTLVILKNGKPVKQFIGVQTAAALQTAMA